MMGTEIFQFGPKGAEKMEIKDFNLYSEIMTAEPAFMNRMSHTKLGFVLEGNDTFTFE